MGKDFVACVQACGAELATDCILKCYPHTAEEELAEDIPPWAAFVITTLLVLASGFCAGQTLGLASLDLTQLQILAQAGDVSERKYARKIIPLRRKGNRLLCTLLLGNTIINSAISIVITALTSGVAGLIISTFIILIVGEIIPQSICSRHGLKIGARSVVVVETLMFIFAPITWPIAWVLDKALGKDLGTVYSQEELKRLIDIHVLDPDAQRESGLTAEDHKLLMGALEYKDRRVHDVMTHVDQCFMLDRSLHLDFEVMLAIYKSGFTRIPVYEGDRNNIVGILYAKDLILVDPEDEVEVGAVLSFRGRNLVRIFDHEKLDKVLQHFMGHQGSSHMLIAHRGRSGDAFDSYSSIERSEVSGIISLEDVIEELLQAEILDETDVYEDVNARVPRKCPNAKQESMNHLVTMYESRYRGDSHKLGAPEVQAIAAFLATNVPEFRPLARSDAALKGLIRHAEVMTHEDAEHHHHQLHPDSPRGSCASLGSSPGSVTPSDICRAFSWNASKHRGLVLYERGKPSVQFTLILQGKVYIRTGREDFQLELGPWSVLGNRVLSADSPYIPDFDAVGSAPVRLLRISRKSFEGALEAARLETVLTGRAVRNTIRSAASPGSSAFQGAQALGLLGDAGGRGPGALSPDGDGTIPAGSLGALEVELTARSPDAGFRSVGEQLLLEAEAAGEYGNTTGSVGANSSTYGTPPTGGTGASQALGMGWMQYSGGRQYAGQPQRGATAPGGRYAASGVGWHTPFGAAAVQAPSNRDAAGRGGGEDDDDDGSARGALPMGDGPLTSLATRPPSVHVPARGHLAMQFPQHHQQQQHGVAGSVVVGFTQSHDSGDLASSSGGTGATGMPAAAAVAALGAGKTVGHPGSDDLPEVGLLAKAATRPAGGLIGRLKDSITRASVGTATASSSGDDGSGHVSSSSGLGRGQATGAVKGSPTLGSGLRKASVHWSDMEPTSSSESNPPQGPTLVPGSSALGGSGMGPAPGTRPGAEADDEEAQLSAVGAGEDSVMPSATSETRVLLQPGTRS